MAEKEAKPAFSKFEPFPSENANQLDPVVGFGLAHGAALMGKVIDEFECQDPTPPSLTERILRTPCPVCGASPSRYPDRLSRLVECPSGHRMTDEALYFGIVPDADQPVIVEGV